MQIIKKFLLSIFVLPSYSFLWGMEQQTLEGTGFFKDFIKDAQLVQENHDNSRIAVYKDKKICIYNKKTGNCLRIFYNHENIASLIFTQDSSQLIYEDESGTMRKLNIKTIRKD